MKRRPIGFWGVVGLLCMAALLSNCGGGANNVAQPQTPPPPPPPPPPAPKLTITTPVILPGTLTNSAYSVTLQAANGVGALTWSINPVSPTALFVAGLSMNSSTGVLS